ncbi:MAG: HlyD family secretion protein, partial [Barnesiella sp.]
MSTENHKKQLKKLRILRTSRWILSTVGLLVIIAGLWQSVLLFLDYKKSETTNDAQIEQYVSPINIKVPGYIRKIYFTEHQYVRKGDTLLVLDDSEYRIRLKEAEAALMDAQAGKNVLETTLNTTQNNAAVFIASIKEAETKVSKLKKDYERYQNLVERK